VFVYYGKGEKAFYEPLFWTLIALIYLCNKRCCKKSVFQGVLSGFRPPKGDAPHPEGKVVSVKGGGGIGGKR